MIDIKLDDSKKYLIAVSGGVDSMVLLHLVKNYNIVVAHFDHGIREDSSANSDFVKDWCSHNNILCIIEHSNVLEQAEKAKKSVELIAREMRYAFLKKTAQTLSCNNIVLAHHQDDNVETMLFNLFRGSHLTGLCGIQERDSWLGVELYRPLLNVSKKDILDYANKHNIKWWEDCTNSDIKYDRNWMRNVIIPMVEERRPNVKAVLARTIENIDEVNDFMEQQAKQYVGEFRKFVIHDFNFRHIALRKAILKEIYRLGNGNTVGLSSSYFDEFFRWLDNSKNGSKHVIGHVQFTKIIDPNSTNYFKWDKVK